MKNNSNNDLETGSKQKFEKVESGIYRQKSNGCYYERPHINGRRTWRSLGTSNLKLAREELYKRRANGQVAYAPKNAVTTGQVIRCYEKDGYPDRHKEKRAGRTLTKETKNCETLLKFWEHIPVDAVTLAACDRYHEWRKKNIMKGYAGNRTVNMELTTLGNAFLWACRKELVRSNPMSVYRPRYCSDKTSAIAANSCPTTRMNCIASRNWCSPACAPTRSAGNC